MNRQDETALIRLLRAFEHDVKNPVGNILGYVSLLREDDTPLTADQADVVDRIEQNCETILALLTHFVAAMQGAREPS